MVDEAKVQEIVTMLTPYKEQFTQDQVLDVMRKKGYDNDTIDAVMKQIYPGSYQPRAWSETREPTSRHELPSELGEAGIVKTQEPSLLEQLSESLGKPAKLVLALLAGLLLGGLVFAWLLGLVPGVPGPLE